VSRLSTLQCWGRPRAVISTVYHLSHNQRSAIVRKYVPSSRFCFIRVVIQAAAGTSFHRWRATRRRVHNAAGAGCSSLRQTRRGPFAHWHTRGSLLRLSNSHANKRRSSRTWRCRRNPLRFPWKDGRRLHEDPRTVAGQDAWRHQPRPTASSRAAHPLDERSTQSAESRRTGAISKASHSGPSAIGCASYLNARRSSSTEIPFGQLPPHN